MEPFDGGRGTYVTITPAPRFPLHTAVLHGTAQQLRPIIGSRPLIESHANIGISQCAYRAVLLTKRSRSGHDDRWTPGCRHFGHRVVAPMSHHHIGIKKVLP